MEHIIDDRIRTSSRTQNTEADASGPAYEAYQILHVGFVVAPIVAGLDKFFNLLVNWEQYLPAFINKMVGGHGHELMLVAEYDLMYIGMRSARNGPVVLRPATGF